MLSRAAEVLPLLIIIDDAPLATDNVVPCAKATFALAPMLSILIAPSVNEIFAPAPMEAAIKLTSFKERLAPAPISPLTVKLP